MFKQEPRLQVLCFCGGMNLVMFLHHISSVKGLCSLYDYRKVVIILCPGAKVKWAVQQWLNVVVYSLCDKLYTWVQMLEYLCLSVSCLVTFHRFLPMAVNGQDHNGMFHDFKYWLVHTFVSLFQIPIGPVCTDRL